MAFGMEKDNRLAGRGEAKEVCPETQQEEELRDLAMGETYLASA